MNARCALSLAMNMTTRSLIGISVFACISALTAIILATQTNLFGKKYSFGELHDIVSLADIRFCGSLMLRAYLITSLNSFSFDHKSKIKRHFFAIIFNASGTTIARFPTNGMVLSVKLKDQGEDLLIGRTLESTSLVPILGLYQVENTRGKLKVANEPGNDTNEHLTLLSEKQDQISDNVIDKNNQKNPNFNQDQINSNNNNKKSGGKLVVYGDSNCIDDSNHRKPSCFWMLDAILEYTATGHIPSIFMDDNLHHLGHKSEIISEKLEIGILPERMEGNHLYRHSKVLKNDNIDNKAIQLLPTCPVLNYAISQPLNESIPM